MYPITGIPPDAPEAEEPLGTKPKFWFGDHQYLFKAARKDTGEDWAEKVSAEIARYLDLPHAEYELARWEGSRRPEEANGVSSANFCPPGAALVLGNELLSETDPAYRVAGVSKFRVSAHTVDRVVAVLRAKSLRLPLGWRAPPGIDGAVQVLIGYLLLDALVGNTDRHDANWGAVRLADGVVHLAPTFDHASSLGCHLTDANRADRLCTKDSNRTVAAFAAKGRSALYRFEAERTPLLTSEAFLCAARHDRFAAIHWLTALEALSEREIAILLGKVPAERISDTAAEFAKRLVMINRNRLLELMKELP
jgi:hypothetical protein